MIVSVNELRKDTVALIAQINTQIDEVNKAAFKTNCEPREFRDQNGNWPLIPLLAAKATAYNNLILLQTTATPASAGGRR